MVNYHAKTILTQAKVSMVRKTNGNLLQILFNIFLINLAKNTEVQIRETDIYANQILFFLLLVGLKFGHCHHRYMSGMPIIRPFISIEQYYLVKNRDSWAIPWCLPHLQHSIFF